jgi:UDP-glucose 4-epimerase
MNVLITGGAGFIGSHLAERLLARGDSVWVVDDLSTGSVRNIAGCRKAAAPQYVLDEYSGIVIVYPAGRRAAAFHFVVDTVDNRPLMTELVDAADVIYHLAAAVGVRLVVESPTRAMEINIGGTELVLELAARKKKRILIASTSEVYGKRERVPFRADDDLILGPPDKGRWSYAASKLIDEFLAIAYANERGLPAIVARLFNVAGPRQTGRYGMVLPNLTLQALRGDDMTVFGDGLQRRCFTHVSDAVGALIALMDHPDAVGGVYNVGSTEETCILHLAQRIKKISGSASRIVFVPYESAYNQNFEDMLRRVPDLSKINRLTGYRPTVSLDGTVRDVIAYQSALLANAPDRGRVVQENRAAG